jgi:4-hydroxybenzoate polyprenyltransferase
VSQTLDADGGAARRPLVVDLDGTLIATDTLWECLVVLLRQRPWDLVRSPLWLVGGRASFKRRVAERVFLDASTLPYREELIAFLQQERGRGRAVYLATACDERIAGPIADHLALFDGVLASDGTRNLAGRRKADALRREHAESGFDYVGNARDDLPVWEASRTAYAVAPRRGVLRRLRALRDPARVFAAGGTRWRDVLRALRPHQWAKNLLIFVPLALTPYAAKDPDRLVAALLAFVAFCLCASAGYVLNDLLDLEADRRHPAKRSRPFALGAIPIPFGFGLFAALALSAFAVAWLGTPRAFPPLLGLYLVSTMTYSIYVKRLLMLDVIVLAGLYTLRVIAGAAAVSLTPTPWLLAFSLFIFLSLAFAKRYSELSLMAARDETWARRRAYHVGDLDLVLMLGSSSGYLSVLVLCLYISSDHVQQLYHRVELLWLLCPLLLYWISRIWFLAKRGDLPGDPVAFAVRDPASLTTGALSASVVLAAVL